MSDEKKSFTVSDRRHFTAEGEARESVDEEAPPPRVAPEPPASTETAGPREPEPDHGHPPSQTGRASEPGDEDEELPPFPADLLGLIGSLATQASVLLAGDPATRRPPSPPELEAVRSIIALLDVLHEKTKGNRTPQEERVMDAVRYELKMTYVARTRAGGA
jgi:hypothetical protein